MTNFVQEPNNILLAVGASITAGLPQVIGESLLPVVPITTSNSSNDPVACLLEGVFTLTVVGEDGAGNAAIAVGDIVYKDALEYNADNANGDRIGVALEPVNSAATTVIRVLLG